MKQRRKAGERKTEGKRQNLGRKKETWMTRCGR
jgi:hypothetical protein